jgi:hypothetical protein
VITDPTLRAELEAVRATAALQAQMAEAATTEPEQRAVADVWRQPRRTKRAAPSAMANAEVQP